MAVVSSGEGRVNARVKDYFDEVRRLVDCGRDKDALAQAEELLGDAELSVVATTVLAALYYRAGALGYATKFLLEVANQPDSPPDVAEALGVLYCLVGNLPEGLYYAKLSTTMGAERDMLPLFGPTFPTFADAMANIRAKPLLATGKTLLVAGDITQALFMIEQHLCVFANDVEALDTYAQILIRQGKILDAIGMLRSIATLAGPSATLLNRLGQCLIQQGQTAEGLACHQEAIARAPNSVAVTGAAMADLVTLEPAAALATGLPQAWIAALTAQAPKTVRPAPKFTNPSPLRIGYVCSGLSDSATETMVAAIARAHDRGRVSVVGFGAGDLDNPANDWVRGAFEQWRNVAALDVATLGALARGEGIHVLVDADGILTPAKCGLFQRNCAPLQVSWLHAPAMIRLPGNFLACVPGAGAAEPGSLGLASGRYLLADGVAAAAIPSPATQSGEITFGAEVTRAELNPRLVMTWGRILQAVPKSMLLLRDTGLFGNQDAIDYVVNLFGNAGVAHRIDVVKGGSRADFAAGIDVALLPFPAANVLGYGEMLAAGLPVVADAGAAGGADVAAALSQAGLGAELVAEGVEQYVAKAVMLASDMAALDALRGRMLPALAATPAFSAKAFATMLEDAFLAALNQPAG